MAAVVLPCGRWAEGRNMRAFPITSLLEPLPSSPVYILNASASASAIIINFNNPNNKTPQILAAPKRSLSLPKFIRSSTSNVDLGGDDSDVDDYSSSLDEEEEEEEEDKSELECGEGEYFEMEKLGENTRRIRSRIAIDAPLHTIWNILTDYERLADFIPGLALCQLLHKTDNYARLFQIGRQNLAFGLKFDAKGILDCYEKELESLPFGQKRDIEFKMIEGDFQLFEGKWSIEESNRGRDEDSESLVGQKFYTTLSYLVDVKPKLWFPVRLVEGRLCNEIKMNLASIREEAQKAVHNTLRVP
ncbi:hypothetical protein FH972_004926 [Carpinus fangiana]|uniref:Coenzyme Q-binding protein COQ10 START domain-containing protein n=1 Tax=Carpinus fangiana TaxID=176857 RepID=A0A5N6QQ37_9ROSI|nr:hypothetical protein FH972_004926 [Carpinus fangiana]